MQIQNTMVGVGVGGENREGGVPGMTGSGWGPSRQKPLLRGRAGLRPWAGMQVRLLPGHWEPARVCPLPTGAERHTGHQQAPRLRVQRKARLDGATIEWLTTGQQGEALLACVLSPVTL